VAGFEPVRGVSTLLYVWRRRSIMDMDERYLYGDVIYHGRFMWNRLKAEANHRKHGITFEKATEVFDDPFCIEEYDEENAEDEDRYNITGFVESSYITVSFTLRGNLTRIFSARKADIEEEEAYDENIGRYIGER
jgi:uncharacterized DUF497 family protein